MRTLTLYAQWKLEEYTLTFQAGDNGSLLAEDTQMVVNMMSLAPALEKTIEYQGLTIEDSFPNHLVPRLVPDPGYEFDQWLPGLPEAGTMISGSATYLATIRSITIGIIDNVITFTYEAVPAAPPAILLGAIIALAFGIKLYFQHKKLKNIKRFTDKI